MRPCRALAVMLLAGTVCLNAERYVLESVAYDGNGKTQERFLSGALAIQAGAGFDSEEAYEMYRAGIERKLRNERIFAFSEITEERTAQEDGTIAVSWTIRTVDSENLLVAPYPKYDSNSGLTFKIKLKDNNFLGRMSPLSLDLAFGTEKDEDEDIDETYRFFGISLDYNFPFMLGAVNARWLNNYAMQYTWGERGMEYGLSTGLKLSLPYKRLSFDLTLLQSLTRDHEYDEFGDTLFATEHALFEVPITLARTRTFGDIVYAPYSSATYNWDKDEISAENEDLRGPYFEAGHGIRLGAVNWKGNFREGFSISVKNLIGYNQETHDWIPGIQAELKAHAHWWRFNPSARAYAAGYHNGTEKIGHNLRGIKDIQKFAPAYSAKVGRKKALDVQAACILNCDLTVKVMETDWYGLGQALFHTEEPPAIFSLLRQCDFELHVSPFLDAALTTNKATGSSFDWRDGFYSGGLEVIVYPSHWRSIQIRASAGLDIGRQFLSNSLNMDWRKDNVSKKEIYVGFGLFY